MKRGGPARRLVPVATVEYAADPLLPFAVQLQVIHAAAGERRVPQARAPTPGYDAARVAGCEVLT